MGGWGGLIELALVFGLVIGFAVFELRRTRRDTTGRKADDDKS